MKVTPPSSFDDLVDLKPKREHDHPTLLQPKSDEDIIREHISAKNKHKPSTKETKRGGQRRPSSTEGDLDKFNGQSLDLDLPPPPSPPCTCGKNLPILPPESILPDINVMSGYSDGKICFVPSL